MNIINVHTKNDIFQEILAVKSNRVKRKKSNLIFVEGTSPLETLVSNAWPVDAFIVPEDRKLSSWAEEIIAQGMAEKIYRLDNSLFNELSDREEPSEILALADYPRRSLSDINREKISNIVLLDRPSNYGNLGTLIRTCDVLGIDAVFISGHGADPFDTRAIRASIGAVFHIPLYFPESREELTSFLNNGLPYRLTGTSAKSGTPLNEYRFGSRHIIIFGNETSGMGRFLKEICSDIVTIPQTGSVSSLNISCAAAIVLWERFHRAE